MICGSKTLKDSEVRVAKEASIPYIHHALSPDKPVLEIVIEHRFGSSPIDGVLLNTERTQSCTP